MPAQHTVSAAEVQRRGKKSDQGGHFCFELNKEELRRSMGQRGRGEALGRECQNFRTSAREHLERRLERSLDSRRPAPGSAVYH